MCPHCSQVSTLSPSDLHLKGQAFQSAAAHPAALHAGEGTAQTLMRHRPGGKPWPSSLAVTSRCPLPSLGLIPSPSK